MARREPRPADKLSHHHTLAQKKLEAELSKRSIELAHEFTVLKTRQEAELTMWKIRCNQDIKDYQHYLESLTQLKSAIQTSYAHLPDAIAHTIHHPLLNAMGSGRLGRKNKVRSPLA